MKSDEGCVIGTKLGTDGKVAEEKTTFTADEKIFMTVRSKSGAKGYRATVKIFDAKGQELRTLWADLDSENVVTVPFRNFSAGRYVVKASLNDQKICEGSFEIR